MFGRLFPLLFNAVQVKGFLNFFVNFWTVTMMLNFGNNIIFATGKLLFAHGGI